MFDKKTKVKINLQIILFLPADQSRIKKSRICRRCKRNSQIVRHHDHDFNRQLHGFRYAIFAAYR